ncbi:MAG: DUF5010 domain-containing protein, partial [Limisphaerales bacterium]
MKTISLLSSVLCCIAVELIAAPELREIPPAFGPHIQLRPSDFAAAKSFTASERIVGTYYFYWYDAPSNTHILNADRSDALTTHPPSLQGVSYKSVAWHRQQLEDMIAAGVDVVLPVFWGAPSEQDPKSQLHWSYEGLPPLVQAREELLRAGKQPPRIGLFYDTSTLQYNSWHEHQDLTTRRGAQWFYATVRDFFSLIPPRHWAMIEDKPIILLYSAAYAKNHDQSFVDHLRAEFPKQFGGRVPWLAREVSWQVKSDSVVAWGGAIALKNPGGIASVGPGYDHSAVPNRAPLIVDRRGGQFYEEQWIKLLRRPTGFVMVETWNEWHEGTDIAESREYARKYIQLTRKYSDLFKEGWIPPWPKGPYSQAMTVSITLGPDNQESGLRLIDNDDGVTVPAKFGSSHARAIAAGAGAGRYIYFAVDDSFKNSDASSPTLSVQYFDAAPGKLTLDFDGSDL